MALLLIFFPSSYKKNQKIGKKLKIWLIYIMPMDSVQTYFQYETTQVTHEIMHNYVENDRVEHCVVVTRVRNFLLVKVSRW